MTALAAAITRKRYSESTIPEYQDYPVKAAVKIYDGAGLVLNAGYAAPATATTGLISVGVAEIQPQQSSDPGLGGIIDNTAGSNGDYTVRIRQGVHDFANSAAGDAIAQVDAGKDCYWVDDATVAKTDNTGARSRAGKIIRLEGGRVYVQLGIGV